MMARAFTHRWMVAMIVWDTARSIVRLYRRGGIPLVLIAIPADEGIPGPYVLGLLNLSADEVKGIVQMAADTMAHGTRLPDPLGGGT